MLNGAFGTYAATLVVVACSLGIGAGVLVACGARRWSWTAPAIGLAGTAVLAWWAVRLPGEGVTALIVVVVAALIGGAVAANCMDDLADAARRGWPVALVALIGVSIPFVAEQQFGILGTGFNVDMSQHLFAADWIADPVAAPPALFQQGYPLGPHALAVATGEIGGELATSFSGITIAIPIVAALTALAAVRELDRWRALLVCALTALCYLAAAYLAQGSFKELFEATLLLGFVLTLRELTTGADRLRGLLAAAPLAVLGAGALYSYSGPGLAWLLAAAGLWALAELLRRRGSVGAIVRASLPALGVALVLLVALAAPELDRIAEFGGSAGNVARAPGGGSVAIEDPALLARQGATDASESAAVAGEDQFDNSLGNLFGQINPLEVFGVWPSGDFRVEPGDGAIPAIVFYLGALLGVAAFAYGARSAGLRGETAIGAALAAALAIWIAARIAGTPYTAAKALQVMAPLVMLVAARGVLDSSVAGSVGGLLGRARPLVAVAFVLAAGASSALALANAPVGLGRYSPGVAKARSELVGQPVLVLVPSSQITDRHADAYYAWELRGAQPACVEPLPDGGDFSGPAPEGFAYVITVSKRRIPPFEDLMKVFRRSEATLWKVPGKEGGVGSLPAGDPCENPLGPGG